MSLFSNVLKFTVEREFVCNIHECILQIQRKLQTLMSENVKAMPIAHEIYNLLSVDIIKWRALAVFGYVSSKLNLMQLQILRILLSVILTFIETTVTTVATVFGSP